MSKKESGFLPPEEIHILHSIPDSTWALNNDVDGYTGRQAFQGLLTIAVAVSVTNCGPVIRTPIPSNFIKPVIATIDPSIPSNADFNRTQTAVAGIDSLLGTAQAAGNDVTGTFPAPAFPTNQP